MSLPEPKSGDVSDIATLLDLEELDRDLFRGRNGNHGDPRYSLFGGQVAAQALRAASRTVDGDRMPHSLHGYFLRPGQPDHPVIFSVDRDRGAGVTPPADCTPGPPHAIPRQNDTTVCRSDGEFVRGRCASTATTGFSP